MSRLLGLLAMLIPITLAEFLTPQTRSEVWETGQQRMILYNTDQNFENYTVALWQQTLAGGSAELIEIIQTADSSNSGRHGFVWEVQTYSADLDDSNKFFFWLFQGPASNQGKAKQFKAFSSAYFTITDDPGTKGSSSIASTLPKSSFTPGRPEGDGESPSSTSSPATSSTSTKNEQFDQQTTASWAPSETQPPASGLDSSGRLPVGAQAGIGVGVAILGVTAIACAFMWFRHLKRQQNALLAQLQHKNSAFMNSSDREKMDVAMPPHPTHSWPAEMWAGRAPQELGVPPPAEIGPSE